MSFPDRSRGHLAAYKRPPKPRIEGDRSITRHITKNTSQLSLSDLKDQNSNRFFRNHQEHDEVHEELHPQIINPNCPESKSTPIHHKFVSISLQTNSIQQLLHQTSSNLQKVSEVL